MIKQEIREILFMALTIKMKERCFIMASFIKKVIKYRILLLMLLPATLFFLVFSYLPMAGIIIAFKRYNYTQGIFKSPWVGFDNFKFLFMSGDLLQAVK